MAPRRQLPKNPKAYKAMEMIVKGKTQNDVADRLNVAQSTVSSWKRQIEGTSGPRKPPPAPKRSDHKSSRTVQVSDKTRTVIAKPGSVIVHEHTRSISSTSKASGAVTKQRSAPAVKKGNLSIKSSSSTQFRA